MSRTINNVTVWPLRTLPKDLGVAAVVLAALLLGLLLRSSVEGGTRSYQSSDHNFSMLYPDGWRSESVTNTVALKVSNPQTASPYKSNVTVEVRDLDPASPPTLQTLIDRSITQGGTLAGYHLLSSTERQVAGARAAEIEYAAVVQPIDTPRSATLPVVVQSREEIVVTKEHSYYITLSAPESDFSRASEQFDTMLGTVKVQ